MGRKRQIAELKRRLREVEDRLSIYQLVASYGPTLDGGMVPEAGQFWTEDGWDDVRVPNAGPDGLHGRTAIDGIARICRETNYGVAHIAQLPVVTVDGDRATVIGHTNAYLQEEGEFYRDGIGNPQPAFQAILVASARWDLVRIDGNWRVQRRTTRILDGSDESKDVFAEGLREVASTE
jgi:hypothetical protein